jgi:hypothetical protein
MGAVESLLSTVNLLGELTGAIVDRHGQEVLPQAVAVPDFRPIPVDAVPDGREAIQRFDIHMEELARHRAFVPGARGRAPSRKIRSMSADSRSTSTRRTSSARPHAVNRALLWMFTGASG